MAGWWWDTSDQDIWRGFMGRCGEIRTGFFHLLGSRLVGVGNLSGAHGCQLDRPCWVGVGPAGCFIMADNGGWVALLR